MSKSRLDRLGDQLRAGVVTEAELRELTEYRASFAVAYQKVLESIETELDLVPAGRPAKSSKSIVEKLRRESIRLSQMQDIAGLRVVVPMIEHQDAVVARIRSLFQNTSLVDRRANPSHGYRAVHIVVFESGYSIEIQVRTELQHRWAEASEKLSDIGDPALKYGGGEPIHRDILRGLTGAIVALEEAQAKSDALSDRLRRTDSLDQELVVAVEAGRVALRESARQLSQFIASFLVLLSTFPEE